MMSGGGSITHVQFKKIQLNHVIDVILEAGGDPADAYQHIADAYLTDNIHDYLNIDHTELDAMILTKSGTSNEISSLFQMQ